MERGGSCDQWAGHDHLLYIQRGIQGIPCAVAEKFLDFLSKYWMHTRRPQISTLKSNFRKDYVIKAWVQGLVFTFYSEVYLDKYPNLFEPYFDNNQKLTRNEFPPYRVVKLVYVEIWNRAAVQHYRTLKPGPSQSTWKLLKSLNLFPHWSDRSTRT